MKRIGWLATSVLAVAFMVLYFFNHFNILTSLTFRQLQSGNEKKDCTGSSGLPMVRPNSMLAGLGRMEKGMPTLHFKPDKKVNAPSLWGSSYLTVSIQESSNGIFFGHSIGQGNLNSKITFQNPNQRAFFGDIQSEDFIGGMAVKNNLLYIAAQTKENLIYLVVRDATNPKEEKIVLTATAKQIHFIPIHKPENSERPFLVTSLAIDDGMRFAYIGTDHAGLLKVDLESGKVIDQVRFDGTGNRLQDSPRRAWLFGVVGPRRHQSSTLHVKHVWIEGDSLYVHLHYHTSRLETTRGLTYLARLDTQTLSVQGIHDSPFRTLRAIFLHNGHFYGKYTRTELGEFRWTDSALIQTAIVTGFQNNDYAEQAWISFQSDTIFENSDGARGMRLPRK